jgi:hypothetical protein
LAIGTRVRCSRTPDTAANSFRVTLVPRVTLVLHGALVLGGTLFRRCGLARPPASVFIEYLRLPETLHVMPAKPVEVLLFGRTLLFDAFDDPFPHPELDPGEVLLKEFRYALEAVSHFRVVLLADWTHLSIGRVGSDYEA